MNRGKVERLADAKSSETLKFHIAPTLLSLESFSSGEDEMLIRWDVAVNLKPAPRL